MTRARPARVTAALPCPDLREHPPAVTAVTRPVPLACAVAGNAASRHATAEEPS